MTLKWQSVKVCSLNCAEWSFAETLVPTYVDMGKQNLINHQLPSTTPAETLSDGNLHPYLIFGVNAGYESIIGHQQGNMMVWPGRLSITVPLRMKNERCAVLSELHPNMTRKGLTCHLICKWTRIQHYESTVYLLESGYNEITYMETNEESQKNNIWRCGVSIPVPLTC